MELSFVQPFRMVCAIATNQGERVFCCCGCCFYLTWTVTCKTEVRASFHQTFQFPLENILLDGFFFIPVAFIKFDIYCIQF